MTLEGWCLYLACPTGTSHWDKHNLSQWDRQIGTNCAYPSGTSTTCPNWDWERSNETSPCPMGQVIYPRWRPFLVPGQVLYPRWSLHQFYLSQLAPQSGSTRPWTISYFLCKFFVVPDFFSHHDSPSNLASGLRFPRTKSVWDTTHSRIFLCVVHLKIAH